jgi:hypothetical protein
MVLSDVARLMRQSDVRARARARRVRIGVADRVKKFLGHWGAECSPTTGHAVTEKAGTIL